MIKYLGSKKKLLDVIYQNIEEIDRYKSFLDVFSGTSRVGHFFKKKGFLVYANDLNTYAYTIAKCYIEGDRDKYLAEAEKEIKTLNTLEPKNGWFFDNYSIKSRFIHPKNGGKVDSIREYIEIQNYPEPLKSILITSLMLAADRVDSTCGVQMAYLKKWATRANNDLLLTIPDLVDVSPHGLGKAFIGDAADIGTKVGEVDIAYLDPPYNQHSYLGNYHMWESLVMWDKPETYGIANKRIDCKERKSGFNSKTHILDSFIKTCDNIKCKLMIVSFNNEGYITRDDMVKALTKYGEVIVVEEDFKRYVGAQIGIYNPSGEKVGKVSHTRNKEYIFYVKVK